MPKEGEEKDDVSNLWDELKDDFLGYPKDGGEAEEGEREGADNKKGGEKRGGAARPIATSKTLPIYVDDKNLAKICKDVLKKRNLRHCEYARVELEVRPYWFFAYTCELKLKDENGNLVDSEEVGGRQAIDAEDGALADYLPETIRTQPVEFVSLVAIQQQVPEAKIEAPRIKESELGDFIKQKIAGVLHANKSDVSVAGFELIYAPVWRAWFETRNKKELHSIKVCAFSGYPLNIDDLPLHKKTWRDVLEDDIQTLKNPKKWLGVLKGAAKSAREAPRKKSNLMLPFLFVALIALLMASAYRLPTPHIIVLLLVLAGIGYFVHKSGKGGGRQPEGAPQQSVFGMPQPSPHH